jgi:predicted nucleic acid-binding protein
MRVPQCTIDSSCVIALDHLNLLPKLNFLFSSVLLPRAVRQELYRRRSTKDRLRSLSRSYAFLKRCNDYDRLAVDLLLLKGRATGIEDRGEAEAVVQAAHLGAVVIVDDPWGRKLAASYALDYHGTIWVLTRLYELKLVSSAALRDSLLALRDIGIRLPWQEVNEFLIRVGEQPIEL